MPLVALKCPGCGAQNDVNDTEKIILCAYCGTKSANPHFIAPNPNTQIQAKPTDPWGSKQPNNPLPSAGQQPVRIPPRPKLSCLIVGLGLIFYVVPGIVYIAYITVKQHEWDNKYGTHKK